MLKSDRYYITPFINDSFDSTIKGLIKYFVSDYLISDDEKYTVSYNSNCIIDNTTVGSNFSIMKRPDKIYITANFMSNGNWTNAGSGIVYCTIVFVARNGLEKIEIRWSTLDGGDYKHKEIDIKKIRKLKLNKIDEYK